MRILQLTLYRGMGAGEGSFFVAKQFRLQQIIRYGATIDRDERPFLTVTCSMNRLRYQLFSRTALTCNKYRHIGRSNLLDGGENRLHGRTLADDPAGTF